MDWNDKEFYEYIYQGEYNFLAPCPMMIPIIIPDINIVVAKINENTRTKMSSHTADCILQSHPTILPRINKNKAFWLAILTNNEKYIRNYSCDINVVENYDISGVVLSSNMIIILYLRGFSKYYFIKNDTLKYLLKYYDCKTRTSIVFDILKITRFDVEKDIIDIIIHCLNNRLVRENGLQLGQINISFDEVKSKFTQMLDKFDGYKCIKIEMINTLADYNIVNEYDIVDNIRKISEILSDKNHMKIIFDKFQLMEKMPYLDDNYHKLTSWMHYRIRD